MSTVPDLSRFHAGWHRWLRFAAQRLVLRGVVGAVVDTEVEGLDNLDGLTEPFVLVANHSSHLDATVLVTALPYRHTRHLAVGAAADYFFNSWWRRAATSLFFNSYPVHRSGQGGKGRGMSQQLLADGVPVLIFPEGTRSRDGVMRAFKPGAAALCCKLGVPCVPVALLGAHDAMPVGRSWPVPGRPPVRVLVGRPMRPGPGEKAKEFNDRVAARVATMLTMQTPYVVGDQPTAGEAGGHPGAGTDGRDARGGAGAQEEAS
ncbi:1-acyl-sn-glycerol-3-phosphate acyltransferase [Georgenia sp. TF02-10]|uniref:lysophospholipid acyltransferase family protein n=1 Tax=Georgenia sp. TF02-10 TaxID=2917725 RepID=UPI001FA71F69|nr:lysophospholipid acyltransferase family protein [Georgenia sp. TF02-10]UNX55311.1 1-acyl-sn-glycerol-3-phosphate acyltransferase [Georgenia sp. TF02-10]